MKQWLVTTEERVLSGEGWPHVVLPPAPNASYGRSTTEHSIHAMGKPFGIQAHDVIVKVEEVVETYPVVAGWWHNTVKGGQVHDHPEHPNGNWSVASHRLCQQVAVVRPNP